MSKALLRLAVPTLCVLLLCASKATAGVPVSVGQDEPQQALQQVGTYSKHRKPVVLSKQSFPSLYLQRSILSVEDALFHVPDIAHIAQRRADCYQASFKPLDIAGSEPVPGVPGQPPEHVVFFN